MGQDILPGHTYTDGEFVNGPSLTEHVGEATIKTSFYSSKTAKDPVVLTDEFLVRDTVADAYRKVTLATLQGLMVGSGGVIQTSYAEYTSNTNLTTVIPADDTIPQNTEGTEILTASITPTFSSSKILVQFQGQCDASNANFVTATLFRDSAASALAAIGMRASGPSTERPIGLSYMDSPSTTSTIIYRIRVGPAVAGTVRFNGQAGARLFGGTSRATLVVQEIKQ